MAQSGSESRNAGIALGASAALFCLLFAADAGAGKLYRWVDEDGNVHFTDRMPAEATREKHSVMDNAGNVVEDRETQEEERTQREERDTQRKAEEQAKKEERQRREEQRRRDRIITQTFATERDIELTRRNRIEAVQVQINVLDHGLEQLQDKRNKQEQQLENAGSDEARQSTRERLDDIESRIAQRQTQKEELIRKRSEIDQRFDGYLERFRELNQDNETADD